MATWTTITDSQVDPDAPLTSGLAYAWRDNPVAIAEGASGAPKIARNIYGGSGATVTFTGLGDFSGAIADIMFTASSPSGSTLSVSLSDDGTTFYGSTSIMSSATDGTTGSGKFWINFATGAYGIVRRIGTANTNASGTISDSSLNVVAVRFTNTGSAACAVALEPNGGIL